MSRIRAVVGLAIIGGCLLFACWALFDLVRFGTCASGGPYLSARECAPGTGAKITGLVFSIFGVLIGVGIAGSARAGLAAWGLGFVGLAATFVLPVHAAVDDKGLEKRIAIAGVNANACALVADAELVLARDAWSEGAGKRWVAHVIGIAPNVAAGLIIGIGYDKWAGIFSAQWMKVLTFSVIVAIAWHAWVGLREVLMDYIKPVGLRLALQVFSIVWLVSCAGWGIQVLWRL